MKHFLRQAYKIETRIDSKLEQLESLRSLAEKATATLDASPSKPTGPGKGQDILAKIMDLELEIQKDIQELLAVKEDVQKLIKSVDEPELRVLLELRYLCYRSWNDIADSLNYDLRWVHRLHGKALQALQEKHATKSHRKPLSTCDMV